VTTPRIYLPQEMECGRKLQLGADHIRYIKNVLRFKKGDALILFNGKGLECDAVIRDLAADAATIEILEKRSIEKAELSIILVQALPKGPKMDAIVEKAAELGVRRIIPCHSSRSIPKLSQEKARLKTARWQKIAMEASRRCGRADIPEVAEVQSFEEALATEERGLKLIFWEEETGQGIKEILRDEVHHAASDFLIVIGPEGGFASDEIEKAQKLGYLSVSLGPHVLKVETASVAILSIIQYERGILG